MSWANVCTGGYLKFINFSPFFSNDSRTLEQMALNGVAVGAVAICS